MTDPTQRFSSRVTNYVKYRPSYPAAIIDLLAAECGLSADSIVADVGSGTGLLALDFVLFRMNSTPLAEALQASDVELDTGRRPLATHWN
jgi:hypothetical protein